MTDGHDIVEQLDRLHAFFADREDADVYPELHRFVAALEDDPRTRAIAHELVADCLARLARAKAFDEECIAELVQLRREIVEALPELADTQAELRRGDDADPWDRTRTLAYFDERAERGSDIRFSLLSRDVDDDSASTKLIEILRTRLHRLGTDRLFGDDESLGGDLMRRVRNVEIKLKHEFREWLLYARTHGAASMLRVFGIAGYLNPPPTPLESKPDLAAFANRAFAEMLHPFTDLRRATFDENADPEVYAREKDRIAEIRTEVRRAYEEVRRRLLSARSHRALVIRFAQWVQLYEREELHALAKKSPRKVEDVLTQRLARFLFERGLNPLTKANIGTTQPDLLDPTARWTFYVEAKQYKNAQGKTVVRNAVKQIGDTLLRVRALPHGVREAFLVVFRIGGPLLVLPSELVLGAVKIWPVLVDLAPSSKTGSRQKQAPVVVEASELLP